MTIREIKARAGDLTRRTVYVHLDGGVSARLLSIGRQYLRVMRGNGQIRQIVAADVQAISD